MAKLFCGEMAIHVVDRCLQLFGGYGYIEEYHICRAYRDMRLITIGGGTSEIMKEIISKLSGL
jgi:alkylation response protein AidB-like acyl-CoA dehydrogenase